MEKSKYSVVAKVGADKLWEHGFQGDGVSVAVIDSGIKNQVDFERNIVEEIDFSGKNMVRHRNNFHGILVTECLLTIAPKVKIGVLKVTDENQKPSKKAVMKALEHCIQEFPKYTIVNLSISFTPGECPDRCDLCKLIEKAYVKEILVTVVAGNKGYLKGKNTITCPWRANWALTSIATLSKSQNEFLTDMSWLKKLTWDVSGRFSKTYGTSFSSPYTAGCAALISCFLCF